MSFVYLFSIYFHLLFMFFTSLISNPFIFPSHHIHPLPLQALPQNKIKFNKNKEREKKKISLIMEVVV